VTTGDLQGRSFLVTGANSGIGRAVAVALGEQGGSVILAGRSAERMQPALAELRTRCPGTDARFLMLDLADLASVRQAAGKLLATAQPIDVLINNAGIAGTNALSRDGFDLTYATNHIGPFLLTQLLLPRLLDSAAGRIVNVASAAHYRVKHIPWSVLERRTTPRQSGFQDYAITKLMNVLHAREQARRLAGTRVTTYAVHPGGVATNIWRALPRPVQWALKLFLLSNEEGARTPLYCATAPDIAARTGRYYDKCREAAPNRLANDEGLARELWARTETVISG
jgi:dehydrogenase/reductase SDR family protein 13